MKSMIATALLATGLLFSSTGVASAQLPTVTNSSDFLVNAEFYCWTANTNAAAALNAGSTSNPRANAFQAVTYLTLANQYATKAKQADANGDFSGAAANAKLAYQNAYRGARFSYYAYLFSPNDTRQALAFQAYFYAQIGAQEAYIYYILYTYGAFIPA